MVLPELIVPGYVSDRGRLAAIAEPLEGPTTAAWQELAGEYGGWIAGGFCEREAGLLYNTAVLVGPDGAAVHYRKLHPFRDEKQVFEPGNLGLPVAELPFGRVGLCVRHDLRFVEVVRAASATGRGAGPGAHGLGRGGPPLRAAGTTRSTPPGSRVRSCRPT